MRLNDVKEVLTEATDWSQYPDEYLELIAKTFGVGPKYVPTPRKTYPCESCGKNTAYKKTFHEDTDMEETTLYCPECKWTKGNV